MQTKLFHAVQELAAASLPLSDDSLDIPWTWRDYKEEGIRFAYFRILEELAAASAELQAERSRQPSEAQAALMQYHTAYRALQASLLGVDDETGKVLPAPEEWPVETVLRHIVQGNLGFYAILVFNLENLRKGNRQPQKITYDDYDRILDTNEAKWKAMEQLPVSRLLATQDEWHPRIIRGLEDITAEEFDAVSMYWEQELYTIRFRMHRIASHMRQHTIQIEKTLTALDRGPGEPKRLLGLIFAQLAEAEGQLIGWPEGEQQLQPAADVIQQYTTEIKEALLNDRSD